MIQTRKRRINRELCSALYMLGYSLEDLTFVFKKEDGEPTAKSVISKILIAERERTGKLIERGEQRIPPQKIPQTIINQLNAEGLYTPFVDFYNMQYQNQRPKNTRFKKDPRTFTKNEKAMFNLGKQLYIQQQKGANILNIVRHKKINPRLADESLKLFMNYI